VTEVTALRLKFVAASGLGAFSSSISGAEYEAARQRLAYMTDERDNRGLDLTPRVSLSGMLRGIVKRMGIDPAK
jgi:hypothetical protein